MRPTAVVRGSRRRLIAAGFFLLAVVPAAAQSKPPNPAAPSPRGPVTAAMLQAMEKLPHLGTAEEAVVGVRVTGTGPNGAPLPARVGCGFVLRCDGFLILPFDLFNLSKESTPSAPDNLTIHVTYQPGSPNEKRVATPRRSHWFVDNMRRMGYTVFRTDDAVHVPALRTLLPDTLKAGDALDVVWREWDAATQRFGPLVHRPAHLAPRPVDARWETLAEESLDHPGRIRLAESLDGAPAGAAVLGPDGMAVGVIPGNGGPARCDSFASFATLAQVTNCAGAVPTPDSLRAAQPPAAANAVPEEGAARPIPGSGEMVKVPGGPIIVPKAMLAEQPDMEGEPVACVAPFEIDRLEVTNGEYLAFWSSLDEKARNDPSVRRALFPLGWAPVGEPFPPDISNLPVLGVPLPGAEAFARSKGKRLPTPYEWARAAFGPGGEATPPEWIPRYLADRQKAWVELCRAHAAYLQANPGILAFARNPIDEKGKPTSRFDSAFYTIPWILLPKGYLNEEMFSFEATEQIIRALVDGWQNPTAVIGAGDRKYDVSPYGAQDMLLNAWELYQPNPGAPAFGAGRYLAIEWQTTWADGHGWQPAPFVPWTNLIEFLWGHSWKLPWPWSEVRLSRLYKRRLSRYKEGWANPAIEPDVWVPFPTKAISPPMPIAMEYLVLVDNLNTMSRMTMPLDGWAMSRGGLYEIGTVVGPRFGLEMDEFHWGKIETTKGDRPAYKYVWPRYDKKYPWAAGALHYTRELGRPPATDGTILVPDGVVPRDPRYLGPTTVRRNSVPSSPDTYYILPVGFRCAR